MCGIAGYVGPTVAGKLRGMCHAMVHRGPDDDGYFEAGGVHLGMRRLSIVDLATGTQPKFSPDRSVVVVFNGEIYNYRELREELIRKGYRLESESSDTEVIPALYQEHGLDFVHRLVGMFAIALYDLRTEALFLIRDRFGKKPIYYHYDEQRKTLEFASEFRVLDSGPTRSRLAMDSLVWYFSQKTMPGDATIDQQIQRVPAGCYLRFGPARVPRIERYYSRSQALPGTAPPRGSASRAADSQGRALRAVRSQAEPGNEERLTQLLEESVALRMRADVEVGAFLSGGVDSSLVVALASQLSPKPLKTYCLVYDEQINQKSADRACARLVAERFKTSHREVLLTPERLMEALPAIVRHFGEPNSAVLSNWFISETMGKDLKVALSGDGADELFGSYFLHRVAAAREWFAASRDPQSLATLPAAEAKFVRDHVDASLTTIVDRLAVFPDRDLVHLLKGYRPGQVLEMIQACGASFQRALRVGHVGNVPHSAPPTLTDALSFDFDNLLCDQVLNYCDLLGMAHSLEIRTPFLDHRVAEFAISLGGDQKIRPGTNKYLLKQVASKYLPAEVIHRPKEGFVEPNVHWIAGPMKGFCVDHLLGRDFNRLGLLNFEYVRELVRVFYAERDFRIGKKVWSLLMYALWEKHCHAG